MTEYGSLTATVREGRGKGSARTLRRSGKVPAIMYGGGEDNVSLSLDPHDLRRATDPSRKWNTFFNLTIKQDGKPDATQPCIVADVQIDSIRSDVVHMDFMRVDPNKEVVRKVPLRVIGRSVGIVKGGRLKKFVRIVKIACKPADVPVDVEVDITNVEVGESLRMKDISLHNVRLVEDPEQRVCFVELPKAKPEETEEDAAAAAPAATPAATEEKKGDKKGDKK